MSDHNTSEDRTPSDETTTTPDLASMSLDRLASFIKGRLSSSAHAGRQAILMAHKSAVDLFWAGSALSKAKDLCEQKGHGEWKRFKEEHSLADSTANDAIRLFKSAKTPDALTGLGITEAKKKFVYPPKADGMEGESAPKQTKAGRSAPKQVKAGRKAGAAWRAEPASRKQPVPAGNDEGDSDAEMDDRPTGADPAETAAEKLEAIAQELNEIAQDGMGKVDLVGNRSKRLINAVRAVADAFSNINWRLNSDIENSPEPDHQHGLCAGDEDPAG